MCVMCYYHYQPGSNSIMVYNYFKHITHTVVIRKKYVYFHGNYGITAAVENITNATDNGKFTIGVSRHLVLWITVFLLPNLTTTELGVLPNNGLS